MSKQTQDVINALLNEAVVRWMDIVRLPETSKFCQSTNYTSRYDLDKLLEDLNQSRELDLSGLTTALLLNGYLNDYLDEMTFSGNHVIRQMDDVMKAVKPLIELENRIFSSPLAIYIDEYKDELREAGKYYGYEYMEELEKFLNRPLAVATVRRDALISMTKLEAHQFVQSAEASSNNLQYNKQIFEFWNVNSLLEAAKGQALDGLTLVLIREPRAEFSYFIFVVKNRSTITVLTDRQKVPHPEYQSMTRRPDRELFRRASEHWFPYQLLKYKIDDEGELQFEKRNDIVPIKSLGVALSEITQLPVEQFVWLILVFNLLNEEYGKTHKLLPELSYTGEMVVAPQVLLEGPHALMALRDYQPLVVEVSAQSASPEATVDQWEYAPTRHNAWIEARYEGRVPEKLYETSLLFKEGMRSQFLLEGAERNLTFREEFDERANYSDRKLATFRADSFGTKKSIQDDVAWTLRRNKMRIIQQLAEEEYEEEHKKIEAWMGKRLSRRKDFLFDALARQELILPWIGRDHTGPAFEHGYRKKNKNALTTYTSKKKWTSGYDALVVGHWKLCGEDACDIKPTLGGEIDIECPEAFAVVLGLPVEELPWPLQHLIGEEPYSGNSILDRLDPQDWALYNPWTKMRRNVRLYTCKRHFNARRKALGLPRLNHKDEEDDE